MLKNKLYAFYKEEYMELLRATRTYKQARNEVKPYWYARVECHTKTTETLAKIIKTSFVCGNIDLVELTQEAQREHDKVYNIR